MMSKSGLVVFLFAGSTAFAASFNCAKAVTPQEKAICASPDLSKADEQMAAAYRAVLVDATTEMIAEIRDGQRAWLRKLNDTCAPKKISPGTSLSSCLSAEYASRIEELQHIILRDGGITFVWRSIELNTPAPPPEPGVSIGPGLPDHGYLNASWPQTNADTPAWHAWNKAIETAAVRVASLRQPPATDFKQVLSPDMDIDVSASVDKVSDRLVMSTIDNQWYGHGAAHPNENSIQFNWLLKEQRELRPEDVFRTDSGWAEMLQKHCDQYLHQTLDPGLGHSYVDDWAPGIAEKNVRNVVTSSENWQLDSGGLTIIFQVYAVACRVCTPAPFTLPWVALKPYLNPDFQIPASESPARRELHPWRLNPQ